MPKVSINTRATTGGSRRRYVKATRGSTGPFFLRYEINGERVWEGLGTRTCNLADGWDAKVFSALFMRLFLSDFVSGYRVLTALDGLTGIALTRNHSIDAIVLDFTMAGMDGDAVAQMLMKEQPRLPIVVCGSTWAIAPSRRAASRREPIRSLLRSHIPWNC
jgi:CheY-like chemotaxis protein